MLKFATDRGAEGRPSLIGLGLSLENLRSLRNTPIQFYGAELDLGPGVVVVAHADDRALSAYREQVGAAVCELVVLTEAECVALERDGAHFVRPMRVTRRGSSCEVLVFGGTNEDTLLTLMHRRGLVPARGSQREFGVAPSQVLTLLAGAVGLVLIAVLIVTRDFPPEPGLVLAGAAMPVATLLAAMARWTARERLVVDGVGIEARRPWRGFMVRWPDIAALAVAADRRGPCRIELRTLSGSRYELTRRYEEWDELVEALSAGVRASSLACEVPAQATAAPDAAGPMVLSRGREATFASPLVATLPHGTRIVDLRRASADEAGTADVLARAERELAAAGPPSQMVVWMVPSAAIARWSESFIAVSERLVALSVLTTTAGTYAGHAVVVAGPSAPALAFAEVLRGCGMGLFSVDPDAPAPVLEVRLGDGRVMAAVTAAPLRGG